jgi:hypothetical protein
VGAGTRLPVERVDVCTCRLGRAPGGVEVGAGARLPVEQFDVCICRSWRASGGVQVGARARLLTRRPLVEHWCEVLGLLSVKLFTYSYLMPISVRVLPMEPL